MYRVYALPANLLLYTLKENLVSRRGLVSHLMTVCTDTQCDYELVVSDPYSCKSKMLNARSVLTLRSIGVSVLCVCVL